MTATGVQAPVVDLREVGAELGRARLVLARAAGAAVTDTARELRCRFLDTHVEAVYDELTDARTKRPRLAELARAAADAFPGLVPSAAQLAAENGIAQADKAGHEIDLGIFFNRVLRSPRAGSHLLDSMRRPTGRALELLPELTRVGAVDLGSVLLERDRGVAYVTLNRPAVLNAMNLRMHEELASIWDDVEADDTVRVAVLTGAGDRSFSVGQDLRERAELDRRGLPPSTFGSRGQPGWPRLTERFGLSKPVLARVHGYALGGGFELALACDIVIASDQAVFGLPEVRLGLVPGAGGAFRLARQVPLKAAMGYLLTGRRFRADEALRLGLVNQVVPVEQLDRCTAEWTDDLVRAAPLASRAIKEAVMRSLDMPLEEAFNTRFGWEQRRWESREAVEGIAAFRDRRDPVWLDTDKN